MVLLFLSNPISCVIPCNPTPIHSQLLNQLKNAQQVCIQHQEQTTMLHEIAIILLSHNIIAKTSRDEPICFTPQVEVAKRMTTTKPT